MLQKVEATDEHRYRVFYMRPSYFRCGNFGYDFGKQIGELPVPENLEKTHAFLKLVEAKDLDSLYAKMQGEVWSPNGEASALLELRDLAHTSMSTGDIAIDQNGDVWLVDVVGWKCIGKTIDLIDWFIYQG